MQVIFNRNRKLIPTINNVLLDTIDPEHSCVEITFDGDKHEFVNFKSLYPYFIDGQIATTRCGDNFIIGSKKYNVDSYHRVLYNLTSLKGESISVLNYNWDYTYYDDNGNRNPAYDIMSFWKITPTANLADMSNGDYIILADRITPEFDDIRRKEDLIWARVQ